MSESGGEKPKDSKRKNIFSVVDKIEKAAQQRREQEQARTEASLRAEGFAVYSDWDNPDRVRRKALFTKAVQMLDALKTGPALSQEAIEEARKQLPNDFSAISYLILNFKHQQLIDEPNHFWAVLDIFFEPLDVLAGTVVDQYSAELDIMTRFGTRELAPTLNFQESFHSCIEQAGKIKTPNLIQIIDEYTRNELGISAPYLLALVREYKNRRKLP